MSLGVALIVKNEEKVLERCLKCVSQFADEIVIVDTGSTDNTINISKKFTDNVYFFDWCDDFSKARNYAFSKVSADYIMWIDADDVVPQKSIAKLKKLKKHLTADTYMFKYEVAFEEDSCTFSFYRERIVKNCKNAIWEGAVHECIIPFGDIKYENIIIEHRKVSKSSSFRNLNIYKKLIKTRPLTPREQYYYGRELFDHSQYEKCIKVLENFIGGRQGWMENIIDAHLIISKCHIILNNYNDALDTLFKTFKYDKPRANICCLIGDIFLSKNILYMSEYWYLLALKHGQQDKKLSFIETKYFTYYPYLQLCVTYFKLGDYKKSYENNERAGKYLKSEVIQNNRLLLEKYIKNNR